MSNSGESHPTYWLSSSVASASNCSDNNNDSCCNIDCLLLGTGRFLRSVLVPVLIHAGYHPALIQTRGRNFLEYMVSKASSSTTSSYEVDTVLETGEIQTDHVPCYGAFSMGRPDDKKAVYDVLLPRHMKQVQIVGIGVTEAGLASHNTQAMIDLYELFCQFQRLLQSGQWTATKKICVINTDNVPNNGSVLYQHMMTLSKDDTTMQQFLQEKIVFLNTMVDRITSQRSGSDGLIPSCEPIPKKALVILDTENDLPQPIVTTTKNLGVVIRTKQSQIDTDIALKLRIANGTHTSVAHVLALLKFTMTDTLSSSSSSNDHRVGQLLMFYLDTLVEDQIIPAASNDSEEKRNEAIDVWSDWRKRLIHPYFGLSTFFITQNGPAKGGIRLGPTVIDCIQLHRQKQQQQQKQSLESTSLDNQLIASTGISVVMAFAFAVLLRWLTPAVLRNNSDEDNNDKNPKNDNEIFTGWLHDGSHTIATPKSEGTNTIEYADKLRYNLVDGWYEFRCALSVNKSSDNNSGNAAKIPFSAWLLDLTKQPQQPSAYRHAICSYLIAPDGGDLSSVMQDSPDILDTFVNAIATLYARMVAGDDPLALLQEMKDCTGVYSPDGMKTDCRVLSDVLPQIRNSGAPLHYRVSPIPDDSNLMKIIVNGDCIESVIRSEVSSTQVIDLHTHLLPPSHGTLCLWGIDELLTYHYLVSEYFMTAPASVTPEKFFEMTKQAQADLIWKSLFIDRSPLSEACRGVVTTLVALGLSTQVDNRDLGAIRDFYLKFRDKGVEGAEEFSDVVHKLSGVSYNIMTNIPFDHNEAKNWQPNRKPCPDHYKTALRIDPFLSGDRNTVELALMQSGYDTTLDGARQFLRDWCDVLNPEYLMASTPHDFVWNDGTLSTIKNNSINLDAMKEPGAFAQAVKDKSSCDGSNDDSPSVVDENSDLLADVVMKVCEERDLPVALKIGAHRSLNPRLKAAGDGVVAFADAGMLGRLCSRFPKVRFLATFLSRNNQHEACVLALKFNNLHIYGCWWYCFTPSIVREITKMRIEMLGTAFTAQHSDARVIDQLLYKWPHSRSVIADVLEEEVYKLYSTVWKCTRAELRRDVARLFGGSYRDFMERSFA